MATTDELGRIVLTSSRDPLSPEDQPFAFVNALVVEPEGAYVPVLYANRPIPLNGAQDVYTDTFLNWRQGACVEKHDVYFGTDEAAVTDANRSNPLGVLVSQGQEPNTYDPYGAASFLDLNTTYYWRIDEVNSAPDYTIFKGEVWSFRTERQFAGEWRYFGQTPPGDTPVMFAPGMISLPGRSEGRIAFSPDGNECYFTTMNSDWTNWRIYYTEEANGVWTEPVLASFSTSQEAGQPFFSQDGNKLYFTQTPNPSGRFYVINRTQEGWSDPAALASPIYSGSGEWSYSESADGNAYFASARSGGYGEMDLYQTYRDANQILMVKNLGSILNSQYNERSTVIAPDESYLIFSSARAGLYEQNLYVSFADGNGGWDSPIDMNEYCPGINTSSADEHEPSLSPDEKYIFFDREGGESGLYWVANPFYVPPPVCANSPSADLNGDCKVDFQDIAVFADEWLDCGLYDGWKIVWTPKTDLPIPLGQCSGETVNGKIYVMGGRSPAFPEYYGTVNYEFNPDSNTWASKNNMPSGKTNFAIAAVNNKIYAIGGDPFSNIVEAYDPAVDAWAIKANMPTPRQHISCGVVNNKIYVVGGLTSWSAFTSKNEVYDPATNTWQTLTPMPTPRHGARIASCNGKIYVLGGMGDANSIWTPRDTVEAYDPITNSWETKEKMPTPRKGFGISVQNKDIFVTGGYAGDDVITSSIFFDTLNNEWYSTTDSPYKTDSFAYATIGNKFYLFGGEDSNYTQYSFTYEGVIVPELICIEPRSADFNGNCKVDFKDFAVSADEWLECGLYPPEACN
jgi:N-acetylneuraminic acid mutarotase